MANRMLYTISFHEVQFTAQVELESLDLLREACEETQWFDEFVTKRMLAGPNQQNNPISFQFGALDGLKNVWFGFWHVGGKCASFTLVKTNGSEANAA